MATDLAVTSKQRLGGTVEYYWKSTETNVTTTQIFKLVGAPKRGRVVATVLHLTAGTGTTLTPLLRDADNVNADSQIGPTPTSGAPIIITAPTDIFAYSIENSGDLYIQPKPDAGSDNTIVIHVSIKEGLAP